MTVNELRKRSQNKELQSEAKNLIKIWKKLLGTVLFFLKFKFLVGLKNWFRRKRKQKWRR